ncbi:autotransporter domain-containing protein [Cetobacterium sp. 2A]|uniref:autotransporter outer membrane beta-barrel domain-containing protein n=1 Tax=Cetobacterium sp. 2A TaxID=2754723 RepID=UPI00163D1556|nr:autotransporter outer membrane beta-barrel domain-containing protein [Cetobacterium sp. 2A]MBC2857075.1 autotransporter domain-containing protein [Cetobacterium sp. 2A]
MKEKKILLMAFLITGGITYSEDFFNDEYIAESKEFIKSNKLQNEGTIRTNAIGIYNKFDSTKVSEIKNNGVIVGSADAGINVTEYYINEEVIIKSEENGIVLEKNDINIINNKVIEVSSSSNYLGNGLFNYNKIGDSNIGEILNNGVISSVSSEGIFSGNGIFNYSRRNSNIGNISNKGIISGATNFKSAGAYSGNGIFNYSEGNSNLGNIKNTGIISGAADIEAGVSYSGNGIFNSSEGNSNIGNIENYGVLEGNFFGSGVYNSSEKGSSIKNIINNGVVKGSTFNSSQSFMGNGITNFNINYDSTKSDVSAIKELKNNGVINGFSSNIIISPLPLGGYSGNGILNKGSSNDGSGSSSIGNISNRGIIQGNTLSTGSSITSYSGNGIYNAGDNESNIGNIANKGLISGAISTSSTYTSYSGNGISNSSEGNSNIGNISNVGIISGSFSHSSSSGWGVGNGISNYGKTGNIGDIENRGVISGFSSSSKEWPSGNGIFSFNGDIKTIDNLGIIKASKQAIKISYGKLSGFINNGILAGQTIADTNSFTKKGIEIKIDSIGNVINIENGVDGVTLDGKTIINGQRYDINGFETDTANLSKDSYITSNGNHYINNIINGAGITKGALIVRGGTSVDSSIINGYNTAVYLENLSQLTATDTIFNGGGLKNDVTVIKGSIGDNVASILGESIVNGSINLDDGNDELTLSNTVQINGNLDGGLGTDILNLGEKLISKSTSTLNIFHEINGFEEINTNGNITLFETAKVTEGNINIENGNLTLRVNPLDKDGNGNIKGHALYDHSGDITAVGGNLIIGLNGLGEGAIIATNGTLIDKNIDTAYDEASNKLRTNSLVLNAVLLEDDNIKISVFEDIPLPPINPEPPITPPTVIDSLLYEKLNKVYQSTVTAGEIGALANTTLLEDKTYEESLGGLLTILDQIYANNPYAYTLKSSRDSLKLFEDNMSYLTIKPKENEWIIQGKGIYTGVKNDNASSGKNYYGFDTGHRNYKTTTSTSGGLATFEYGLSDKTSIGGVIGGNNQDINFKGSSKIKGNSLYLGTFAKTDINNFKLMAGLGYQYTAADADRSVSNMYDSFKTSDKYDINSLNAFAEVKYSIEGNDNWTLEPKARLSYYYIEQDSVNEGYTPGQLSIAVDKANSNTADLELGIDLIKNVYLQQGKLKNIFSFGLINTIGDKSKELNGYVLGNSKDGNKFDIQGVELPRTSGKVAYNLELEQTSGMIYTAGVSMEFAKDYNRNASATIGLGYKF